MTLLQRIEAAIREDPDDPWSRLADDDEVAFWVDHRDFDLHLAGYVDAVLQNGRLAAVELAGGLDLFFDDARVRVPLRQDPSDRELTMFTIDQLIRPEFRLMRLAPVSEASDGACYLAAPAEQWDEAMAALGSSAEGVFETLDAPGRNSVAPLRS